MPVRRDPWELVGTPKERLSAAAEELHYLLDRGYRLDYALRFVGDHHQLRETARQALVRMFSLHATCRDRSRRRIGGPDGLGGARLAVDCYNVLITVESGLRGRLLVMGLDRALRDVSRVGRSFTWGPWAERALELLDGALKDLPAREVTWYLDAPVSGSGRLASRLREMGWGAEVLPCADALVTSQGQDADLVVASADAVVLDKAAAWWDLAAHALGAGGVQPVVLQPEDLGLQLCGVE